MYVWLQIDSSVINTMKDYNHFYYYLKLPIDATNEEIEEAYRDEIVKATTWPEHKRNEQMICLNKARECLINPKKRSDYHSENYPSYVFADSTRTILKGCKMWHYFMYVPRRRGPMPTSFEGQSAWSFTKEIFRGFSGSE